MDSWDLDQNSNLVPLRVFDEDTGRMRLVKGTGEILEECVSRERQQAINRQVIFNVLRAMILIN